jgi:hypothetical protein
MINYFTFAVALILSVVAAYFSIVGLATLFAAAMIPVIVMGSTLEAAKLVALSWLHKHWQICPVYMKSYLIVSIVILMFITSMGTFGFLSKAHIDQTIGAGDTSIELKLIDQQIDSEKKRIANAQKTIESMDRLVDQTEPEKAVNIRKSQAKERARVNTEITEATKQIKELSIKALPLRKESLKQDAEVGPIKYIAQLFKEDSTASDLEKAVRWVIMLIVSVFDPLAVILFLAAYTGIDRKKELELINNQKSGIIEIDKDSLVTFK